MAGAPPPVKGKGFSAWFTGHKTQAYIGAAGVVATIALVVKSRNKAAAAGASTTSTAVPTTTADTTQSDAFNGIEDQVLGLQSAILAIQNPQPTAAPGTPSTTTLPGAVSQPLPFQSAPQPVSTTPAVASAPALAASSDPFEQVIATETLPNSGRGPTDLTSGGFSIPTILSGIDSGAPGGGPHGQRRA
jgi:hypothetical protein